MNALIILPSTNYAPKWWIQNFINIGSYRCIMKLVTEAHGHWGGGFGY